MVEMLLRLVGGVLIAGGLLDAVVAVAEYGRYGEADGAAGAAMALQFRIDLTDSGLLLGAGALCFGMAAVLFVTTSRWEDARDPYDDHPKMAREIAEAMEPLDLPELDLPDLDGHGPHAESQATVWTRRS